MELAQLDLANRQEVFNFVWAKLKEQGQPSTYIKNPDLPVDSYSVSCRYRGDNDCKCAVGHLIPDDEYKSSLEGKGVAYIKQYCPFISKAHSGLLWALQVAHDEAADGCLVYGYNFLEKLEEGMRSVARRWKLEFSP